MALDLQAILADGELLRRNGADLDGVTIAALAALINTELGGVATDAELTTAVSAAVAALVDSSPSTLDTLNELAAALGDDANFASTMTTALAGKVDESVLTTDGDLYTRAAGVISRITRAALAADPAFTGTYAPLASVDSVWLGVGNFQVQTGSPGISATGGWPAWFLDASATETVHENLRLPQHWSTFDVEYWYTNAGAGAGNVKIGINHRFVGDGEALGAGVNTASVTSTAPAQNVMEVATVASGIAATTGKLLNLRVFRLGGDAADTLANDIGLLGVRLVKAS